jgi:hypothetical protein
MDNHGLRTRLLALALLAMATNDTHCPCRNFINRTLTRAPGGPHGSIVQWSKVIGI